MKIFRAVMAIVVKGGPDTYDAANKLMLEEYTKHSAPKGEICFLAAEPAVQGKGIGTKLLDELIRRKKGNLIYLYTDDNCTYQFYKRKGFERAVERQIEMEFGGRTVPLPCFLYSKLL